MDENLRQALTDYVPLLLPEGLLAAAACVFFLGGTWGGGRRLWGGLALVVLAAALGAAAWTTNRTTVDADRERLDGPGGVRDDIGKLRDERDRVRAGIAGTFATPAERDRAVADMERALAEKEKNLKDGSARLLAYASSAPVLHTRLSVLVAAVALAFGFLLVLCGWSDVPDAQAADYFACLLLIVAGTALVGAANDLITLFLALELVSIPTYVLLYLPKYDAPAQEAAMKYFLLSVFSSALLLFGFSYLYGVAGSTNLSAVSQAVAGPHADAGTGRLAMVALVLAVAGLGFRVTAVPFHFYAPDVYQGTATANAALLAFVPKVVGFVALLLLLRSAGDQLAVLLWILAAVTMTLGNVLALLQDNVKRMLAYSSVAHSGYMLMGLAVWPKLPATAAVGGAEAVLFYLVAYGAMTVGAFAVLSYLSTAERPVETVDDIAGLGRTHPGVALTMTLFLFSLIGMPLTAGFAGKLQLFIGSLSVPYDGAKPASVEQARLFIVLAVIAALNAAIGGWYYLRLIAAIYLRDALQPLAPPRRRGAVLAGLTLCAALTLGIGVYPAPLQKAVRLTVRGPEEPPPPAGG